MKLESLKRIFHFERKGVSPFKGKSAVSVGTVFSPQRWKASTQQIFSRVRNAPYAEYCEWPNPPAGFDFVLLVTVLGLLVFGLIMLYSASYIFAQERTGDGFALIKKQVTFACVGITAMLLIARIDYRKWKQWAYPTLAVSGVLLVATFIPGIGSKVLGAQRWIKFGSFGFQPSELVKFAVLIFVARQLSLKKDRLHTLAAGVLSPFVVPLPALLLLLKQPDFGTTVMIGLVVLMMMYIAGVPKRFIAASCVLAGVIGLALALGTEYRRQRVITFLDPWRDPSGAGFQILQSWVGFQQGSIWGVGLGNGKEKLFYLPEAHNDFIFSVIGEELGFIGVILCILAYLVFIYRGLRIGFTLHRQNQDRFGLLLACGITLALGLQAFVNMAVTLGLLPTKGLTLPFVSYGGSALLVDLMAVGVLLSIARGPQAQSRGAR